MPDHNFFVLPYVRSLACALLPDTWRETRFCRFVLRARLQEKPGFWLITQMFGNELPGIQYCGFCNGQDDDAPRYLLKAGP